MAESEGRGADRVEQHGAQPGSGDQTALGDGSGVRAHYVFTKDIDDVGVLAACRSLLTPEEIARHAGFRSADMRHEYLVAHALLRFALSSAVAVAPEAWAFATTSHGRPEIAHPRLTPRLRFNLSHTKDLVACAIVPACAIGIDVENTEQSVGPEVAAQLLTAHEASALRALPAVRQRRRFFDYWTLKESYAKARGLGLSIPFDRFAFQLDEDGKIDVRFAPTLDEDAAAWQFALRHLSDCHVLAVAVQCGATSEIPIHFEDSAHLFTA